MELLEAIKKRRSIRKFKPDPVSEEDISELLEAAKLAPSGSNIQPWRFIVVKSEEKRMALNEATPLPFVAKAPVVLVCCVDTQSLSQAGKRAMELKEAGAFVDTPLEKISSENKIARRKMDEAAAKAYLGLNSALAIDHVTLRATDLGLGTCWVMMFEQDKVKKALNIEDRYNVIALLPVGYPDQDPKPRPRLTLDEIVLEEI